MPIASCRVSATMWKILGDPQQDWRIAMIDTGIWRNIGQRLWAVREHVAGEEMFFANYSDGLCDVDLAEMIADFRASGKVACFLAVRPSSACTSSICAEAARCERIRASEDANLWINGGFFIFRNEIFRYMQDGDELVEAPFRRLIEADQLMAFRHEGFWRPMDTLKDRQVLEDLVDKGTMPWRPMAPANLPAPQGRQEGGMKPLCLAARAKGCRCFASVPIPTISRSARAPRYSAGSRVACASMCIGWC